MIETLFEFLRKPLTPFDISFGGKLDSEHITKVRIVIEITCHFGLHIFEQAYRGISCWTYAMKRCQI